MQTLYISQQGCHLSLRQESVLVKQGDTLYQEAQLPLLEQILILGQSQVTTQVIRACLQRNIPIVYLSRMGYCYGRISPVERGYRYVSRYQQERSPTEKLQVAKEIVQAKLKNSRVILQRQHRRRAATTIATAIQSLENLVQQASLSDSTEQLMGIEGVGAISYFSAFDECLAGSGFTFSKRSRRPPADPVNAMLSFGYQILWNHILSLVELQGLDPYYACLHQGSERHPALASDLIEEFRAPIVDSLVLFLINRGSMNADGDFDYAENACYLNEQGRKKYLRAFVQRMEEELQVDDHEQPRWDLLTQQVKAYKQYIYDPTRLYQPYLIR